MTYNSKTQDVTLALLRGAILGEDERLPFDVGHIDADIWKEAMEAGFLIVIRSYEQVNKYNIYGKNYNYHCYL